MILILQPSPERRPPCFPEPEFDPEPDPDPEPGLFPNTRLTTGDSGLTRCRRGFLGLTSAPTSCCVLFTPYGALCNNPAEITWSGHVRCQVKGQEPFTRCSGQRYTHALFHSFMLTIILSRMGRISPVKKMQRPVHLCVQSRRRQTPAVHL